MDMLIRTFSAFLNDKFHFHLSWFFIFFFFCIVVALIHPIARKYHLVYLQRLNLASMSGTKLKSYDLTAKT